jgi:hypothetical protein
LAILVSETAIVRSAPDASTRPSRGLCLEMVCRDSEFGEPGLFGQHGHHTHVEIVGCVQTGADGRAADAVHQPRQRGLTRSMPADLTGIAELLAQRHGHGVHRWVRPDFTTLHCPPCLQRLVQHLERRNQVPHSGFRGRDMRAVGKVSL